MTQERIKDLLVNQTIKNVEFGYNSITLVLNQGIEIEIDADTICGDAELTVGVFETKRTQIGVVELS